MLAGGYDNVKAACGSANTGSNTETWDVAAGGSITAIWPNGQGNGDIWPEAHLGKCKSGMEETDMFLLTSQGPSSTTWRVAQAVSGTRARVNKCSRQYADVY